MTRSRLARALIVLLLLSLLAACGGGDDDSGGTANNADNAADVRTGDGGVVVATPNGVRATLPPSVELVSGADVEDEESTASIRFFHGLSDVDRLSVAVDNQIVFRNVAADAATLPIRRTAGEHTIEVISVSPGQVRTGEETVYFSDTIEIEDEQRLILVLVGTAEDNRLLTFTEDLSPLEPGATRLRFVNLLEREAPLRVEDQGEVVVDAVARQSASENLVVAPGAYTFDVLEGDALVESDRVELDVGTLNTVVMTTIDGEPRFVVIENDTPPQARVRFTNAAPDTPPLQVWLNGELKFEVLQFGETTEFEVLPAQLYDIALYRGAASITVDETTTPAQTTDFALPEFGTAEVVIYGPDNNLNVEAFELDTTPVPSNTSRVTFINTAFEHSTLEMYYATRDESLLAVPYNRSTTVNLPPAQTRIFFIEENAAEDVAPVESTDAQLEFREGTAYSYVIVGRVLETQIFNPIPFVETTSGTEDATDGTQELPSIQVVNGWDQILQVNIGQTRVAFGLQPGDISETTEFQPGPALVEVVNPEGQLLFEQSFSFSVDIDHYTLFISRADASVVLTSLPDVLPDTSPGIAQVRLVHLHPAFEDLFATLEATATPVGADDATPEVEEPESVSSQLLYRSGTGWLQLNSGEFELSLADPVAREFVLNETLNFEPGEIYDVLVQQGEDDALAVTVFPRTFE